MRGTFTTFKRPARIRLRITVQASPVGSRTVITDVMLQPGGSVSGWLPHVSELPWSPGVVG